jgi:hypothetical protein
MKTRLFLLFLLATFVSQVNAQTTNFGFTGSVQTFTAPANGTYKLEVWGAQGGSGGCYSACPTSGVGGKGGYVTGLYYLTQGQTVSVYVGGQGAGYSSGSFMSASLKSGGWNGGGSNSSPSCNCAGSGGGGATDIRIGGTALSNRVLVAGGGGGAGNAENTTRLSNGGDGGGPTLANSTQIFTRTPGVAGGGSLGQGANATQNLAGGGGGGFMGGGAGDNSTGGGAGTSNFCGVSNGSAIAGNASMPNPSGGTMVGRTGNGYARISLQCSTLLATPTAVNASRCSVGSLTISVSNVPTGATVDWYASAASGCVLAGGSSTTSFTTPSLSSTTVYYAQARNTTTGCLSPRVAVTATINPSVALANAVNGSRCGTGTVALSVSGVPTGTTIDWYAAATGGTVLTGGTGTSSFTTPSISATTIYYAETRNLLDGCVSATRRAVTASVNPLPGTATAVNGSRCGTGTVALSVSGVPAGTTIDWYAAATGGTALTGGTGTNSFTTPSISTNTTYYAQTRNTTTGCVSATRTAVTATINPGPAAATAVDGSRCGTGTVALSVSGVPSGTTIDWYAAATGGTVLTGGTGTSSYTTPSISATTTYYAQTRNSTTGCLSTTRTAVTATVNAIPALATAVNGSRCATGTVALSVSGVPTGTTIDWYATATGGTVLTGGTGTSSFTTPSISATTTYYAETRNTTTGCVSATRRAVTATVNPLPGTATAVNGSRCGTGTVALSVSGVPAGTTIDWYAAATGGTALTGGTGTSSFTTPSISATTTYYAQTRNTTTGCVSATRTAVTATINPGPAAATAVNGSRCGTGTVALSVSGVPTGTTIDWYAAATGGTVLTGGTGTSSYTTPSISSTTIYYAQTRTIATGCLSTTRTAVTATVNAIPALATAVNGSRCATGTVALSVSGVPTGTTIDWYAAATGGTVLTGGTGTSSFTTPSISATTTYYAETRNTTTGCVSTLRRAVTATVNPLPGTATAVNGSRCGTGTVALSVSGVPAGTTIDWYAAATGGTALTGGTGTSSFTTPSISATTTYYAQTRNTTTGCVSATRTAVAATINPGPAAATAVDGSRCGTGTVALSVSGVPTGTTIDWYAAATGGTVLTGGTGTSSYTTPSISSTTIYYAETRTIATGCLSTTRTAVTATVNAIPALATAVDGSSCGPDTVALSVINVPTGTDIDWYDAATGGTLLQSSSATYTSPLLSTTTVYYAESRDNTTSCISSTRTAVTATIHDVPTVSISKTDVLCNGDSTGTALALGNGGTQPYNYAWSNGIFTANNAQLSIGVYLVSLTDANNCEAIDSVEIAEPSLLVGGIDSVFNISCNGLTDGYLRAGATGGMMPYTIVWSTQDTTNELQMLMSGMYSVTITDSNMCMLVDSFEITEPSLLESSIIDSMDAKCYDSEDGYALVLATGGTQPYAYLWSNGQTMAMASNIGAGQYSVVVTDSNGCTSTSTVEIGEPAIIDTSVTVMEQTLTATLDSASYQWYNCETGLEILGATERSYTASINGIYSVMVTQDSCSAMSECYEITTVGREELQSSNNVKVYPNPNSGRFYIQSDYAGTYNIMNGMGQLIRVVRLKAGVNQELELGTITTGIYYLIGSDASNKQVVKKIVITQE